MTARYHDTAGEVRPPVTALFPGSFNPFTIGHLSVIERALPLFDRVIIVVGVNESKNTSTPASQRVSEIEAAVAHLPRVSVMSWDRLTVELATKLGARYMIRGARTTADFEYEYTLSTINRKIADIETIIIPTLPEHAAISSSVVRELSHFGHDVSQFIPSK